MLREQNNASGATVCRPVLLTAGGGGDDGRIARNRSSTICTLYRATWVRVEGVRWVMCGGDVVVVM
jgi:hypothetical protein